jgi:hypothetical protein
MDGKHQLLVSCIISIKYHQHINKVYHMPITKEFKYLVKIVKFIIENSKNSQIFVDKMTHQIGLVDVRMLKQLLVLFLDGSLCCY